MAVTVSLNPFYSAIRCFRQRRPPRHEDILHLIDISGYSLNAKNGGRFNYRMVLMLGKHDFDSPFARNDGSDVQRGGAASSGRAGVPLGGGAGAEGVRRGTDMRVCVYIYIYIYICIYTHHVYIYIYIYIEREREIDIYIHTYIICVYIYIYICIYTYSVYTHVYVYIHIYIYIYMYTIDIELGHVQRLEDGS